ncbi:hypothetical protein [Acinetobacter nosocomialis]|uniref:hypothetical protein n=1 Tax=Acinetobacter nosocomialis TaxID=106654 RepID=UPI001C0BD5F7|nr:hypothetical protein [Acinetobacter nosocomialis]MBU3116135.1 hypothetical protein [Acinetobacter nosocomialis]
MQWLKTCLSLFLSFAILLVGSAAAASSVHKRCLMPSEHISMQMEMSSNQGMMHTDCMKTEVKIKKDVHDPSCMSEQDCIMSFAKIAYANIAQDISHSIVFSPIERSIFYSPDQDLPSPYPSGLWKPPRSN